MQSCRVDVQVEVDGRKLKLSNLQKVFYPSRGFTKGQVIDYYTRVGPVLLPHLKGRALTLKRYPDGVAGKYFYEKNCPGHRPDWVKTAPIPSSGKGGITEYCVINDMPSLVWAANLASLEMHTSLAVITDVGRPQMMVFDLDPGAPAAIRECCQVALLLHEMFEAVKLQSFPKTSGSKGLQVYVPINTAVSYDDTKTFALAVAQQLEQDQRDLVVSSMKKSVREGRVFVDWSQNDRHKTTVSVYSLRATDEPMVSAPVHWSEVEACAGSRGRGLGFRSDSVLKRLEAHGDLFAPMLKLKQKLPRL